MPVAALFGSHLSFESLFGLEHLEQQRKGQLSQNAIRLDRHYAVLNLAQVADVLPGYIVRCTASFPVR